MDTLRGMSVFVDQEEADRGLVLTQTAFDAVRFHAGLSPQENLEMCEEALWVTGVITPSEPEIHRRRLHELDENMRARVYLAARLCSGRAIMFMNNPLATLLSRKDFEKTLCMARKQIASVVALVPSGAAAKELEDACQSIRVPYHVTCLGIDSESVSVAELRPFDIHEYVKMSSTWRQYKYLLRREAERILLEREGVFYRTLFVLFYMILFILTWSNIGTFAVSQYFLGRIGILFFLANGYLIASFTLIPFFRSLYSHDFKTRLYGVAALTLVGLTIELPLQFFFVFLTVVPVYYSAGLRSSFDKCMQSVFLVYLASLAGWCTGLCVFVAGSSKDVLAPLWINILLGFFNLYTGLLLLPRNMPGYMRWLIYVNPAYHAFSGLAQIQFRGETLTNCDPARDECNGDQLLENFGSDFTIPVGVIFVYMMCIIFVLYGIFLARLYYLYGRYGRTKQK